MNKIFLICGASLVFLSACSGDISGNKTSFNPPILSENNWQSTGYPFKNNDAAYCVVNGGENNIRLVMELQKGEVEPVNFIESTRVMYPGISLTINSSDNSFKTTKKSLSAKNSSAILNDILSGQKVYLRWSQRDGGGGRSNFTNIISPRNFMPSYQKCQEYINEIAGNNP